MTFCAGLTGGLASGKSTASRLFAAEGAAVIDADEVGRELTAPGGAALPRLRKALGADMFDEGGDLRRAELRERAFSDPALRRRLEAALHPPIRREMLHRMRAAASLEPPYVILSAPLLLESGMFAARCHRIAVVDCAVRVQIERARARDGVSAAHAKRIIAAQMSRRDRLSHADDVIDNSGDKGALRKAVRALHRMYIALAAAPARAPARGSR